VPDDLNGYTEYKDESLTDISTHMDVSDEESEYGPDRRGHKSRERKCIALGEVRDPKEMVRFVRDPENKVIADISGKLPGRGTWVSSERSLLEKAIKTNGFARGFKSKVTVPDDLVEQTEAGLKRSSLALISMGKKSGQIVMGFDQTIGLARDGALGLRKGIKRRGAAFIRLFTLNSNRMAGLRP